MPYQVIVPKGSAPPLAPYSPGAKAGNVVYVSGTLALDGNVGGPLFLMEKYAGIRAFLHVSSTAVYQPAGHHDDRRKNRLFHLPR